MSIEMADDPVSYWNEVAGPKWVQSQQRIDEIFAPITEAVLNHAEPREGERVLDIGCGCGTTTWMIAERVGHQGSVLGLDVSRPMLAYARTRGDASHVDFELGNAENHAYEPAQTDLLFSRFGVMFFQDSTASFAQMRRALVSGGRLVFVCWQSPSDNPWLGHAMEAFPEAQMAAPTAEDQPGPFRFASSDELERILFAAGYRDVTCAPLHCSIDLGEVEAALEVACEIGPFSRLLSAAAEDERPKLIDRLRQHLRDRWNDERVVLGSASWLVSAHNH